MTDSDTGDSVFDPVPAPRIHPYFGHECTGARSDACHPAREGGW